MTILREAAQFALDALHCPGDSELMDRVEQKLRAALAEQPAEQESMAVACQISALGDSWADFPLERAQEAIEHGLNVRYLGVLRQKPVKPAEQEPVAWSVLDKRTGKHWYTHESRFTSQHYANEYSHREPDGSQSMCVTPLYTAPPPRKPLTDEEIEEINVSLTGTRDLARMFARAIEAAHGITGETK